MKFFNKKKEKKTKRRIVLMSNIIQRDSMGYPLRLCITSDNKQIWIDTYDKYVNDYDKELRWQSVDIDISGNVIFPIKEKFNHE